jgi:hypothetical protein
MCDWRARPERVSRVAYLDLVLGRVLHTLYDRTCYMPDGLLSITSLSYFNGTHNLV